MVSTHALTKVTTLSDDDVFRVDLDPANAATTETERGVSYGVLVGTARTDAEIAAGVTPVDLKYEPGNVKRFGAVGDGSDDTTAIQDASDAATAGQTLFFPPGYTFGTTNTVTVANGIGVDMQSPIVMTKAAHDAVVLSVGTNAAANVLRGLTMNLWVTLATVGDWSNTADGCILLTNPNSGRIYIKHVSGGHYGVKVLSDGFGSGYCHYHIQETEGHKKHLWLDTINSGWINANQWVWVKSRNNSATNLGTKRWHFYAESSDDSYPLNNTNQFIGPTIESVANTSTEVVPFFVSGYLGLHFEGIRLERTAEIDPTTDYLAEVDSNVQDLRLGLLWLGDANTSQRINYTNMSTTVGPARAVFVQTPNELGKEKRYKNIFDSGSLKDKWSDYDGAGSIAIQGMSVGTSGSTDVGLVSQIGIEHDVDNDFINFPNSRSVGVRVIFGPDTEQWAKQLTIYRDYGQEAGADRAGRNAYRCYKSDGTQIVSTDTKPVSDTAAAWTTAFGGAYWDGGDTSISGKVVTFHDDVAYVDILWTGGSNHAYLKRVWIDAHPDASCIVDTPGILGKYDRARGQLATAIPAEGTHEIGTTVYDDAPAASGTEGWICTKEGTFSAATDPDGDTDGSTAVITGITDTSDFLVNEYVTVSAGFASASEPYKILALTSTTMTLELNSNSSQTNVTIATVDPVFKTFGVIAA